jgi:hypothetical protein
MEQWIKLNQIEKWDYLGKKNLSLLQIASTKLYSYHPVIMNVIKINWNQSLIMAECSQSNRFYWQKQKHQIHWIKYFIIWVSKFNICIK